MHQPGHAPNVLHAGKQQINTCHFAMRKQVSDVSDAKNSFLRFASMRCRLACCKMLTCKGEVESKPYDLCVMCHVCHILLLSFLN